MTEPNGDFVARAAGTPPATLRGQRVVWITGGGRSCVHRAFQNGYTFCSRAIPTEHLEPNAKDGKCGRCDTLFHRAEKYRLGEKRPA